MDAPPFPTNDADLETWSVYADWLQSHGDPRGERIAWELAVPAAPDREQLAAFHARDGAPSKQPRTWWVGHALSWARVVEIKPGKAARLSVDRQFPPDHGTLANVTDFLRSGTGARVEDVAVAFDGQGVGPHWRRLFEALPASCTRVELDVTESFGAAHAEVLLDRLPATVRVLELYACANGRANLARVDLRAALRVLATDRLDVLGADRTDAETCAAVLDATSRLRLRVREITEATGVFRDRMELGAPGDAALITPSQRHAVALPRMTLPALERGHGVVPIRAQLAGTLLEQHDLDGLGLDCRARLQRVAGAWNLRTSGMAMWVDGELVLPRSQRALPADARLDIAPEGHDRMFVLDGTAAARRLLG